VTLPVRQQSHSDDSLGRVRRRLTTWYAGTFAVILLVLGTGMFATITRQYDHELDESLQDNAREVIRVLRVRGNPNGVFEASEIRIPDRLLYVTDSAGRVLAGPLMPKWLAEMSRQAARAGAVRRAHDMETPSGESVRLIRAYAEPVRLPNGEPVVVVAAADEVEIEDRYTSLIVIFTTAALAAIVLVAVGGSVLARQSTAPIEHSIGQRRRFMADAAHELRTPLTILRSRAEVTLQRPREPGDYVTALQAVERESTRLGGIVDDLLMLARADAGERPVEHKPVFLDDVVFDAAETARVIADQRSVRLEFGDLPETSIVGDRSLLVQLAIILLDNAIKYTPGGGTVRVAIIHDAATATLTVVDTGVGIAPEHLPWVFDRFYRADPARGRDDAAGASGSEGVGLGLAIARWIAEQHDAKLSVASSPGAGTTASATFSLSRPVPAADQSS
jgi:signal transduction histidine kinase